MVLPSKSFSTDVTRVRSLVRVSSLVDQQVVALGELPVAELANVSLARLFTLEVAWRRGGRGNGCKEELVKVVGKGVKVEGGRRVEG